MEEELEPHNTFVLFWDCHGLEACHDITGTIAEAEKIDRENLFERLKDPEEEPPNSAMREIGRIVQYGSLRARMNSHRNYEMYLINTNIEITKEQLISYFEENPQATADLIRARGKKLVSYRDTEAKRIIE